LLKLILIACTILGGIAAAWFFIDKVRSSKWRLPARAPKPAKKAKPDKLQFPTELVAQVERWFPGWRLPVVTDLCGDWELYIDPEILSPLLCTGKFFNDESEDFAAFLLSTVSERHKVVVFSRFPSGSWEPYHLTEGFGIPVGHFLATVPPGEHSISRAIWKHGGPKTLHLHHDAIEVGKYESYADVYYWHDDARSFFQQAVSD